MAKGRLRYPEVHSTANSSSSSNNNNNKNKNNNNKKISGIKLGKVSGKIALNADGGNGINPSAAEKKKILKKGHHGGKKTWKAKEDIVKGDDKIALDE